MPPYRLPVRASSGALWILTGALVGAAIAACASPPPNPLAGGDFSTDTTTPSKTPTKKGPDGGAGPVGGKGAATEDDDDDPGASRNDGASKNQNGGGGAGACIAAATSSDSGHHNPGQDCLSCHANLEGKVWTIAGTVLDATGAGISGATIEVTDANGQTLQLVTAANGNFYTLKPVSFPVKPRASKCPGDQAMSSSAQNGSCNTSSCHDSSNPIHL